MTYPTEPTPQPEITVQKSTAYIPVSVGLLQQIEDDKRSALEAEARWAAMTPEQKFQAIEEHNAQQAAAKAERTCLHCGCESDEHGGY